MTSETFPTHNLVGPEVAILNYGPWKLDNDDPFPKESPNLTYQPWTRTTSWRRQKARRLFKVFTCFGLISNLFAYAFDKIWVATALVMGSVWYNFLDEHVKRWFYYNSDSIDQTMKGLAYAISATAGAGFFQICVIYLPFLFLYFFKTGIQRRNRESFRRFIKIAIEHDPCMFSYDFAYDSDEDPKAAYYYYATEFRKRDAPEAPRITKMDKQGNRGIYTGKYVQLLGKSA